MARLKTISTITVLFALMAGCMDSGTDTGTGTGPGGQTMGGGAGALSSSSPVYPTAHPRIYLTPNRTRLKAALDANTPAASRFRTRVDQWVGGADIWGFGAWNAALLGSLTSDAKYCTKAIAAVEAQVATAESTIAAGGTPQVAHDSYLAIGEMVGDLALVYDWCNAALTDSQRARWVTYANQAIWNVWNHQQAKWGSKTVPWSGWSVNNPSNNYYYSFLRATMLVGLATRGENPQADAWLTEFRTTKIIDELIPTFDADLTGGASREGTGYGVSMRRLFELYDFWAATTGESLATATGHTRASLLAFMHQIMPTLDRVATTGDQTRDATGMFYDYHRNYLQELISLMPHEPFSARAKTLLADSTVPAMTASFMLAYDFLYDGAGVTAQPLEGMSTTYYASGIGELYARSGWDKAATWVNLIAGPYTESHAHQDQGSIMIYKGAWLAYDSVINSKSGINQETTSHSLVRIDSGGKPLPQIATTTSKLDALHKGKGYVYASADLTPAYNGNAAVQQVHRELVYLEPDVVIVFDRVATAGGTTQTWQLVTPTQPAISGNTATISNAGHSLQVTRIAPATGPMSTYSFAAGGGFTGGFRIDEHAAGGDNRFLHVLGVDGAVASATPSGSAAQPGVTIQLAKGGTASVQFTGDGLGATLTVNGVTTKLGEGVDTLAE